MKACVEIIRENHYGAHFKTAVCKQADAAKEHAISPLKITWLVDINNLLICIIEWCED